MNQHERFVEAFTAWDRLYRAEPEAFMDEWPDDGSYGEQAAIFFEQLLSKGEAGMKPEDDQP